MASVWLGLFAPDAVQMRVKGGKAKKAFNALAIVVARDHMGIEREELGFELGAELASAMINLGNPKMKDITDLLAQVDDGFYLLAWGDKKPHKKKGIERSYMPVKRLDNGWLMCSRRPPYHALMAFQTLNELAEAILRRMRRE